MRGNAVTRELDTSYVQWGKLTGKQQKHTLKFWKEGNNTRAKLAQAGYTDEACRTLHRCHLYYAYQPLDAYGPAKPTAVRGGVHERQAMTTFRSFGKLFGAAQGFELKVYIGMACARSRFM